MAARLLVWWLVLAQVAVAQPPVIDGALRALNDAGKKAFAEKRYADALTAFQEAHARSGLPEYLFNIATVQRLLGNCDAAAQSYRRFLAAVPATPNRAQVEARLADVERCAEPATLTPPQPIEPASVAPPTTPPAVTAPPSPLIPTRPAWPWVVAGAGGAAVAVGVGFVVSSHLRYGELAATCAPACGVETWSGFDVRERVGLGLVVGGGLVAAVGVLLALVLPVTPTPEGVAVRF